MTTSPALGGKRKILTLVSIALIFAASLVGYIVFYRGTGEAKDSSLTMLVDKLVVLDGSKAEKVVYGAEAVRVVKSIHYNPEAFNPKDALIIVYSDGSRLWITVIDDPCSYTDRMAERMRMYANELPYTEPSIQIMNGVKFYVSIDKRDGSLHVFWCIPSRNMTVWFEIRSSDMLKRGFHELLKVLMEG